VKDSEQPGKPEVVSPAVLRRKSVRQWTVGTADICLAEPAFVQKPRSFGALCNPAIS